MKAQSLNKRSVKIEEIYNSIRQANGDGRYKYLIAHFMYVSDDVRLQLIKDGYKVYEGKWDNQLMGLMIEW